MHVSMQSVQWALKKQNVKSKCVSLLTFICIILAFICSGAGLYLWGSKNFKSIDVYKNQNSNLSDKRLLSLVQAYVQI